VGAAPLLDVPAQQARHCWDFCAGWMPERLPIYGALYPVADWHQLIDLMQVIRRNI